MICLSLTRKSLDENLREIERYKKYLDLAELRADCLEKWDTEALKSFPRRAGLPIVFSLRRSKDGGFWKGGENERCSRIAEVLSSGYTWVDLEKHSATDSVAGIATQRGVRIIRSLHDPDGVPAKLTQLIRDIPENDDEIPRAIIHPRSVADLRLVFRALRETSGAGIIQAMGKWAFPARILAGMYGCLFSLVSPEASEDDPLPLSPETLEELYRCRSLSLSTSVYGIIGNPVLHSRSPLIHNTAYRKQDLNAVYLPFQVDDVDEFFALADELSIQGFSVTIPYKSEIIPRLQRISDDVAAIGACNTVVRTSQGFAGYNTDVRGFLLPLEKLCGKSFPKRAVIIGAGGAARAVVYGLQKAGTEILIVNRTEEKALNLAREFGCRGAALSSGNYGKMAEYAELVVQTSAAGMHPLEDVDPAEGYPWTGEEIAYDLVYVPETTRFLVAAKAAGCRTLNGAPMLQAQGEAQYKLFTGMEYPR
jgi:3-dehydroquinate dehydratase/shikimate dehydrogenase